MKLEQYHYLHAEFLEEIQYFIFIKNYVKNLKELKSLQTIAQPTVTPTIRGPQEGLAILKTMDSPAWLQECCLASPPCMYTCTKIA